MLTETATAAATVSSPSASQSPDGTSPDSNESSGGVPVVEAAQASPDSNAATQNKSQPQVPPPKTDKPRPHVCGSCGRAFARLEHLKRHERSHTKEKPFECPECTRCFARRDLLLRHQQKLHNTNNTSSRPRGGRRESVSGTAANTSGKVRKNSVANNSLGGTNGVGNIGGRPRANTIGHLDLASLGLADAANGGNSRMDFLGLGNGYGHSHSHSHGHGHRMSMNGLPGPGVMGMRGMAANMAQNAAFQNLPKLETHAMSSDFEGPLRTAPPMASFGGFQLDQLLGPGSGNTINPAQLHFNGASASPISPYQAFPSFENFKTEKVEDNDEYAWMRTWEQPPMAMNIGNENAIDESSPSRISSAHSQGVFADGMMDMHNMSIQTTWPSDFSNQPLMTPAAFQLDTLGSGLPSLDVPPDTISPQQMHDVSGQDAYFNLHTMQSNPMDINMSMYVPAPPISNFSSDSPSMSSSMTGSARQSSVTSVSTDSITDATRQALLISLSQPSVFGLNHRKYSQPSISSPLSPGGALRSGASLPSTSDLQRYVNAYINCFHPHMPFLHVPTLSFDSPDYISNLRSAGIQSSMGQSGIMGGGGCLILAMAAIGALYEYDHTASKELFDAAKKMIQLYLEERRKADMSAAVNGAYVSNSNSLNNTPLWLVQAMLLNVVYGHNCGDKQAAEIASNHCAALVSLARAAELAQPAPQPDASFDVHDDGIKMEDGHSPFSDQAQQSPQSAVHLAWCKWKVAEERKRTLFAIFILSSLLVMAYNATPAIMNSEILLDLPCDEELWAAESAGDWLTKGGSQAAEHNALPFAAALSKLLTANQRSVNGFNTNTFGNGGFSGDRSNNPEFRPSTFGCLVLINALHNYIWETRNRHHGRQWTAQETEAMFTHIEPALNAWQRAWKAHDHHHLQRPNPFQRGPLSADSIPLLDLAFVRLFANLGRSKEAFWARDFDAMANEIARGAEVGQQADGTTDTSANHFSRDQSTGENGAMTSQSLRRSSQALAASPGSKRERHLRKAAFYAADSLTISSKFALTFADGASHELPLQSAMCFFDCSQVLAEWACTVQERVGRYLGVLGRDEIDYSQVPAIMLLETEDIDLLIKIEGICHSMEEKMVQQANMVARELGTLDPTNSMTGMSHHMDCLPGMQECGLGSKILKVTAYMLEKAAVWPITHVMAGALETHADHINLRANASLTAQQ